MKASRPHRYEHWKEVPTGWVTKTAALRDHGIDVIRAKLVPVGEIRLRNKPGRVYAPLYQLPSDQGPAEVGSREDITTARQGR